MLQAMKRNEISGRRAASPSTVQHSAVQCTVMVLPVPAFPQDDSSAGSIYSLSTLT